MTPKPYRLLEVDSAQALEQALSEWLTAGYVPVSFSRAKVGLPCALLEYHPLAAVEMQRRLAGKEHV